jgi:hypothetical protein
MHRFARSCAELVIVAIVGAGAFLAPVVLSPPAKLPHAPLFPLIRAAVEGPHAASFAALAVVGLVAGLFARTRWYFLGAATMACFPVFAFAEMNADPTSHNLFPFEFVMYAIYSVPAILGAAVSQLPRSWFGPRPQTA